MWRTFLRQRTIGCVARCTFRQRLALGIARTETRRGATHVAARWYLAARHRAPWKWIPPPGLTTSRGTAVQLVLNNQLSPLLDAGYVEEALRRHFEPMLDSTFDEILGRHYRVRVTFDVDGRELSSAVPATARVPISIRLGRRRTGLRPARHRPLFRAGCAQS